MTSPAEPGGIVSRAIILNAKLSVHARLLYAVLCCCVIGEQREIERSKPELIDDSGLSRATLHRAMAELIEAGIVEVHSSVNSDGGTRTNRYRLHEGGLTQRLPPVHTETPGVSEGDPLSESPAQTPVSHGDPGGSHTETGEGVSEGDGGLIYKKDRYSSSEKTLSATSLTSTEEYKRAKPDPAPEETPVVLLNLNDFDDLPSAPAKTRRPRPSQPTDDPDFDRAWEAYGHKVDRVQARKAWNRAVKKASAEAILAAIPAYVAVTTGKGEPEGTGTAWKPRRKNLATWLNNEGWTEEIEAPKTGYQGQAGSDVKTQEGALDRAKTRPICKLMRNGPVGSDWDMNFAWYYHWNVQEQRDWTVEQMLETGNTPEDVDALMDAYANGIDPQLYQRLLDDYNIPPHGSDAR